MNKKRRRSPRRPPTVDAAFKFLENHTVREAERFFDISRGWLNELKHRFRRRHKAMLERKRIKALSKGTLGTTPTTSMVGVSATSKPAKVAPNAVETPKVGQAFLKRALRYAPQPKTDQIIYGLYLGELRRRSGHGSWTGILKSVFGMSVRTAQRNLKLADAVMKKAGLRKQCDKALLDDRRFPQDLVRRISEAVGQSSLRRLQQQYSVD